MTCPMGHALADLPAAGCGFCLIRDRVRPDGLTFAAAWADPVPAARPVLALPVEACAHLGPATGDTRPCQTCGNKDGVAALRACAVHGVCAETQVVTLADGTPVRCCRICTDKKAPPPVRVIDNGAGGLGDGVQGLLVVAALKAADPDTRVRYQCGRVALPFVALFDGYDELGLRHGTHEGAVPGGAQMNRGYRAEQAAGYPLPRWERYRRNAGAADIRMPRLRDPDAAWAAGADLAGCVLICPFSTDVTREYPVDHWLAVEAALAAAGVRVVWAHSGPDRLVRFRGEKLVRPAPVRLAGAMLNARAVVGVDSGPAHLAGALGCRVLVLGGPTPVRQIFGCYPGAAFVQAKPGCAGCPAGECVPNCEGLGSLPPPVVAEMVRRLTEGKQDARDE